MTADLRAALRAAVLILLDPVLRNDENTRVGAAERFRALADAPPTVAELIAALRSPSLHGRQFVEWQSADDGDRMRARRSGARGFVVENSIDGAIWHRSSLTHSDLTQPATLVEVTP